LDWSGYNESQQGDVDHYWVYAADSLFTQVASMNPMNTGALPAGTNSYLATGLIRGTQYFFAVVAVDTKGNANTSVTPISVVTNDVQAPDEITDFRVASQSTSVRLSWSHPMLSSGDLAGYRVYFNNAAVPVELGRLETSFEQTGLNAASGYSVVITSLDNDGNESAGFSTLVATLLPNPADVAVEAMSNAATLTWDAAAQPELLQLYRVYYSRAADFDTVQGMSPAVVTTNRTAQVTGLQNGVVHYFAVTAVNISGGETLAVTTVSATPELDNTGPVVGDIQLNATALQDGFLLLKNGALSLTASDSSGVDRVEFYLDTTLIGTDSGSGPGYSATIDIQSVVDGHHNITIDAYDTLGNMTQEVFSIVIKQPPPAPCFQQCIDG
jgi:hypothetical protein